jgi:hypothetical protein
MRWPGNGLADLDVYSVAGGTAPARVIHWAGMKAIFLHNMVGGDLLQFFENFYYTRLPAGTLRRIFALWRHVWINVLFAIGRRIKLRRSLWFGHRETPNSPVLVKPAIGS